MMSARLRAEPGHLAPLLERHCGQVGHEVADLSAGNAEAPHRLAGLALSRP